MDIVEINPLLDKVDGNEAVWIDKEEAGAARHVLEGEQMHGDQLPIKKGTGDTVRLGIELVASALGKSIM